MKTLQTIFILAVLSTATYSCNPKIPNEKDVKAITKAIDNLPLDTTKKYDIILDGAYFKVYEGASLIATGSVRNEEVRFSWLIFNQ